MTDRSAATAAKRPTFLHAVALLCLSVTAYCVFVIVESVQKIPEEEAAVMVLKTCAERRMQAERIGSGFVCFDDGEWRSALRDAETGAFDHRRNGVSLVRKS